MQRQTVPKLRRPPQGRDCRLLVDHLLTAAGYRQWVLTFPWALRFRRAVDRPPPPATKPLCPRVDGFSLHAAQAVAAEDRRAPPADRPADSPPIRRTPLSWAQRLHRVFFINALTCPRCSAGCPAAMVILAFLPDPPVFARANESTPIVSRTGVLGEVCALREGRGR